MCAPRSFGKGDIIFCQSAGLVVCPLAETRKERKKEKKKERKKEKIKFENERKKERKKKNEKERNEV